MANETRPVGPMNVKLFVYAADDADLQHIAAVAKEVADKSH